MQGMLLPPLKIHFFEVNAMNEIWKPVVGYEGLYEVSNMGRVRSLDKRVKTRRADTDSFFIKGRMLTQKPRHGGYLGVQLWRDGKCFQETTHRIVAKAFIPNPENLPQVNHKDEDKTNNCVENLEWCTAKYNANYGTRNQRQARRGADSKNSIPIAQYTLDGELIRVYCSYKEAFEHGYCYSTIAKYMRGEFKRAYGFHWELANREVTR